MSIPIKNYLPFLGILALAFILRIWGVAFGLPHLYHADEPIVVNHALAYGTGDLNPHFFRIPPLVSYLLFFVYGLYFLAGKAFGLFGSLQDFEFLFYADPTSFYLIGRIVLGVILGTLTVGLFYRLIKKHFCRETALIGAFFLAVCFLHVRASHYIYADVPLLMVMLMAFCVFFQMLDQDATVPTGGLPAGRRGLSLFKLHLLAGGVIGLAVATKYNGIALVIPYLYVSWVSSEKRKLPLLWLSSGLMALAVYALLNPYGFLDWPRKKSI